MYRLFTKHGAYSRNHRGIKILDLGKNIFHPPPVIFRKLSYKTVPRWYTYSRPMSKPCILCLSQKRLFSLQKYRIFCECNDKLISYHLASPVPNENV